MTAVETHIPYPEHDMAKYQRRAKALYADQLQFEGAPRVDLAAQVSRTLHDWIAEPAFRSGVKDPYKMPLSDEGTDGGKPLFANLSDVVGSGYFVHAPFVLQPSDYAHMLPGRLHHWDSRLMGLFNLSTYKAQEIPPAVRPWVQQHHELVTKLRSIPLHARGATMAVNFLDSAMRLAIDARIQAEDLLAQEEKRKGTNPHAYDALGRLLQSEATSDDYIRSANVPFIRLLHAAMNKVELTNAYRAAWPEKRYLALAAIHYHAPFLIQSGLREQAFALQDLALSYLHPNESTEIKNVVDALAPQLDEKKKIWQTALINALEKHGIRAEVKFRNKSIYSIWEKLLKKAGKYEIPEELGDLLAGQVTVKEIQTSQEVTRGRKTAVRDVWVKASESDCYRVYNNILPEVLGELKRKGLEHYETVFDLAQYEDYIARPKRVDAPVTDAQAQDVGVPKPPGDYRALQGVVVFGEAAQAPSIVRQPTILDRSRMFIANAYERLLRRNLAAPEPLTPPAHIEGIENLRLRQMEIKVVTEEMHNQNESGPLSRIVLKQLAPEPTARPVEKLIHGLTYDPNEVRVGIRLPGEGPDQEPHLLDVPQNSTMFNILMHHPEARDLAVNKHLKLIGTDPSGHAQSFSYSQRIVLPEAAKPESTLKPWYVLNLEENAKKPKPPTKTDLGLWSGWVDSRWHAFMSEATHSAPEK